MHESGLQYRAGLTQLRALSVVLVLLFHAGVIDVRLHRRRRLLRALGVPDLQHPVGRVVVGPTDPARLVQFYGRRCRRILPLSLLVLAVTAVASHFVFETLVDDWVAAGRAAAVWSENWFLIAQLERLLRARGDQPLPAVLVARGRGAVLRRAAAAAGGLLLVLRPLSERSEAPGARCGVPVAGVVGRAGQLPGARPVGVGVLLLVLRPVVPAPHGRRRDGAVSPLRAARRPAVAGRRRGCRADPPGRGARASPSRRPASWPPRCAAACVLSSSSRALREQRGSSASGCGPSASTSGTSRSAST